MILDYLMKYGWAILILLVALGAISYLGIFVAAVFAVVFGVGPWLWLAVLLFAAFSIHLLIYIAIAITSGNIMRSAKKEEEKTRMRYWLIFSMPCEALSLIAKIAFFGYFAFWPATTEPWEVRAIGIAFLAILGVLHFTKKRLDTEFKTLEPFAHVKIRSQASAKQAEIRSRLPSLGRAALPETSPGVARPKKAMQTQAKPRVSGPKKTTRARASGPKASGPKKANAKKQ